jgi:hypothetical protein
MMNVMIFINDVNVSTNTRLFLKFSYGRFFRARKELSDRKENIIENESKEEGLVSTNLSGFCCCA